MKSFLKTALEHLKQAFPFLPEPDISTDERYGGFVTHPGFHTTEDIDIAAAYALGRVLNNYTEHEEGEAAYVTDYPVVAVINTEGAEKYTDYDAENFALDGLKVTLEEMRSEGINEESSNEEIRTAAYEALEFYEHQSELSPVSSPMDFFSEQVFMHFTNPLNEDIVDHPDFPDAVRNYMKTGNWTHTQMLMQMTNQYRYTVPIDNLVGVYFVQPIAEVMSDYDSDVEMHEREWAGFDIPWVDDLYSGNFEPVYKLVWGEDPGLEYHGTTFSRLQAAFPDITFPEPPSPPYGGSNADGQ